MRSTLTSLIIGLIIILAVGFGGYYIVNKLRASADVENSSSAAAKADINKDGVVNALDLNALNNAISSKSTDKKYDLNSDGKVDTLDLNVLITNYSS
ncbi:MAG: dockerin type I domain-containing protein [Patescibacteria group bacterium]